MSPVMGWLPWKIALAAAIPLLVMGVLWRPAGRHGRTAAEFAREAALVLGLYGLWTLAGRLSLMHVDGAMSRGMSIWRLEGELGLPSEAGVQRLFLGHDLLVRAFNQYYEWVHVPALIVFLIWLFLRHRDRYPTWRTSLAVLTGVCLVIQLVPVAPPRMFGGLGFVDTGNAFGESVYGPLGSPGPAQLAAVPSLHVGWAVLIGWSVVTVSSHPWRWWALAHPLLTTVVVVVTANHWWLDGIVAIGLLVAIRIAMPYAYALARVLRGIPGRSEVAPGAVLMPSESLEPPST
jgi:PAP2 superfamily